MTNLTEVTNNSRTMIPTQPTSITNAVDNNTLMMIGCIVGALLIVLVVFSVIMVKKRRSRKANHVPLIEMAEVGGTCDEDEIDTSV